MQREGVGPGSKGRSCDQGGAAAHCTRCESGLSASCASMLSARGRYDCGGTNCANMTAARATLVRRSGALSGSEPLAIAGRIWWANSVACAWLLGQG